MDTPVGAHVMEQSQAFDLLRLLSRGWTQHQPGAVQEFLGCWRRVLGTTASLAFIDADSAGFTTDLSRIRVRGTAKAACLLLSGRCQNLESALHRLAVEACRQGSLAFVFGLPNDSGPALEAVLPRDTCVSLGYAEVLHRILASGKPWSSLKQIIREQVPLRRLNPYQITRPVDGAMFFGRTRILNMLDHDSTDSFAIVGPGRSGKSSLLAQYRFLLARARDSRIPRLFAISFHDLHPLSEQEVCRRIAMRIAPSSRAHSAAFRDVSRLFTHVSARVGGPLELLLDEVDEVCKSRAFELLVDLAKSGLCRIVLAGRGTLLREMAVATSPLSRRLVLVHLGPLDPKAARALVVSPLSDLGISVTDPRAVLERIFGISGRLPSLLQYLGLQLVEHSIATGNTRIDCEDLEHMISRYESLQVLAGPLLSLENGPARKLALTLLQGEQRSYTLRELREVASSIGLEMSWPEAFDAASHLYMCNILTYCRGRFSAASPALAEYARQVDID